MRVAALYAPGAVAGRGAIRMPVLAFAVTLLVALVLVGDAATDSSASTSR